MAGGRRTAPRLAALLLVAAAAASAPTSGAGQPIGAQTSVERLLADADADRRALRLTSPSGNNALERYRRVLSLDPGNARASEGLVAIVRRYVELVDEAIARSRFDRAAEYLRRAETVLPQSALVAIAREDLERARAQAARALPLATSPAPAIATPAPGGAPAPAPRPTPAPAAAAPRAPPAAPAPAPAPARPLASAPEAVAPAPRASAPEGHRLAIFPFETIVPCFVPVGKEERIAAERYVGQRADAELVWSYYDSGIDDSAIPPASRLWSENRAKPVPRGAAVAEAARRVGADTTLMAWYLCSQTPSMPPHTYSVEIFVIDERGQTSSERRPLDWGPDAVRARLAEVWGR